MSHIKFSVKAAGAANASSSSGNSRGEMADLEAKIVDHILETLKSEEQMKLIIQQANWRTQSPNRGERVSRPRNPYILFRTIYVKSLQTLYPKEYGRFDQKEGSRDIGRIWKSLSDEDQLPFNELAEIEKTEHRKCHPTYRFKHSKPTNGGRKKVAYEEMGSFRMASPPMGTVYPPWYDNAFSSGKVPGAPSSPRSASRNPVFNATIIPARYTEKQCVQRTGSQWRVIKPPPHPDDGSSQAFQLRPVDDEGRKRRRDEPDDSYLYSHHLHHRPPPPSPNRYVHRTPPRSLVEDISRSPIPGPPVGAAAMTSHERPILPPPPATLVPPGKFPHRRQSRTTATNDVDMASPTNDGVADAELEFQDE